MRFSFDRRGGIAVLALEGALGSAAACELARELRRLGERSQSITVDLSRSALLDAAGVAVLINARRRLLRAGKGFSVCVGEGSIAHVFDAGRLWGSLNGHRTLEAAIAQHLPAGCH